MSPKTLTGEELQRLAAGRGVQQLSARTARRLQSHTGGNPLYIEFIYVPIILFFAAGAGLALWYRSRDPQRYEAIGRFVHQDV